MRCGHRLAAEDRPDSYGSPMVSRQWRDGTRRLQTLHGQHLPWLASERRAPPGGSWVGAHQQSTVAAHQRGGGQRSLADCIGKAHGRILAPLQRHTGQEPSRDTAAILLQSNSPGRSESSRACAPHFAHIWRGLASTASLSTSTRPSDAPCSALPPATALQQRRCSQVRPAKASDEDSMLVTRCRRARGRRRHPICRACPR